MARISISTADIAAELAALAATDAPADAKTCAELAVEHGIGDRRMREVLKWLSAQGRLRVHMVRRTGLDGRQSKIAGYTIAPKKKGR
jgi:hypothetical protein